MCSHPGVVFGVWGYFWRTSEHLAKTGLTGKGCPAGVPQGQAWTQPYFTDEGSLNRQAVNTCDPYCEPARFQVLGHVSGSRQTRPYFPEHIVDCGSSIMHEGEVHGPRLYGQRPRSMLAVSCARAAGAPCSSGEGRAGEPLRPADQPEGAASQRPGEGLGFLEECKQGSC